MRKRLQLVSILKIVLLVTAVIMPATQAVLGTPRSTFSVRSQLVEWEKAIKTIKASVPNSQDCRQIEDKIDQLQLPLTDLKTEISLNVLQKELDNPPVLEFFKQQQNLETLHLFSHCLIQKTLTDTSNHRITWDTLEKKIAAKTADSRFLNHSLIMAKLWFYYLTSHGNQLKTLYSIPHPWNPTEEGLDSKFVKSGEALLTPGLKSMWNHCQKRFNRNNPEWKVTLQHGFQSNAYQFYKFIKYSGNLKDSLSKFPPPKFGGYQERIPDIKVNLVSLAEEKANPAWSELYRDCKEFGFTPRAEGESTPPEILRFAGIDTLYEEIFNNELLPRAVARDLRPALDNTQFYPSPTGLRMILALSAQESTVQWNPKLNKQKKRLLQQRFNNILLKIKNLLPSSVSDLILSEEYKVQLDQLIAQLNRITDENNESIREYDFYVWSRQTLEFIETLTADYQQIATVGQWFIDLRRILNRLKFEPQTFGLWQINVNHLIEKMHYNKQLRRAFPQIYYKDGETWKVRREWLIDSLSGRPDARLSREKTLELIIHTHLKPRYENHHLGDEADLDFFVAENMSGEMSTYRAAIQSALNRTIKTQLKLDGDLNFYQPYSKKIRWSKPSESYQALIQFVQHNRYYFSAQADPVALTKTICRADSRDKLLTNELYQKLIGKGTTLRLFPDIKSSLYNQTPYQYAKTVRMKSRLF